MKAGSCAVSGTVRLTLVNQMSGLQTLPLSDSDGQIRGSGRRRSRTRERVHPRVSGAFLGDNVRLGFTRQRNDFLNPTERSRSLVDRGDRPKGLPEGHDHHEEEQNECH